MSPLNLEVAVGWDKLAQRAPAHQGDWLRIGGPSAARAASSHPTLEFWQMQRRPTRRIARGKKAHPACRPGGERGHDYESARKRSSSPAGASSVLKVLGSIPSRINTPLGAAGGARLLGILSS